MQDMFKAVHAFITHYGDIHDDIAKQVAPYPYRDYHCRLLPRPLLLLQELLAEKRALRAKVSFL